MRGRFISAATTLEYSRREAFKQLQGCSGSDHSARGAVVLRRGAHI